MQPNNPQRLLATYITTAALSGLALWIGLLMQGAGAIRTATASAGHDIAVGSLVLNHLSKRAAEGGGYVVGFSFESGLLWYAAGWLVLGAIAGYMASKWQSARGDN